jgi:hypothetical protein
MKISSNINDTNYNYLVIEKGSAKFILKKYKTEKKYHSVGPNDLKEVILLYLKYHPLKNELKNKDYDIPFLVDDNKELKNSTEIIKFLNKIFDKKISSSMLRNIFLSSKYGNLVKELKEDTKQMGTSVDTAMNNYIKKD